MNTLTGEQLREFLSALVQKSHEAGDYVVREEQVPAPAWSLTAPGVFVLVRTVDTEDRTFVEIAGGAAWGCPADPALSQAILLQAPQFDWGGPWAALRDSTLTYGMRLVTISDLLTEGNLTNIANYFWGMFDTIGQEAAALRDALLPRFGGYPFTGEPDDAYRLFSALLGPPPPPPSA
jgi:hypothetical protein